MSTYQNSIVFDSVADITFSITATEVKILVKGATLGSINQTYPVSVYVTTGGGVKTIYMKEIMAGDYTQGNTNNTDTDTIALKINTAKLGMNVQGCPSNPNRYKIIGWENDTVGQACVGGNGSDGYYEISNYLHFKSMIEMVTVGNTTELRMVTRYASDVNNEYSGGYPSCANTPYCYVCRA